MTKTNCTIYWIVIYPADSVIYLSNNPGQVDLLDGCLGREGERGE